MTHDQGQLVKRKCISIVTPFYNESEGIECFYIALTAIFKLAPQLDFEVVCIDDGSTDNSLQQLIALTERDARFRVSELSRHFGKEAALTAGIDLSRGEAVIPFDADLQAPPELLLTLIQHWEQGAEVVLARRANRQVLSFSKRKTAQFFYWFHNALAAIPLPKEVGDFRLMDRRVVEAVKRLPERQRFMKGLFAWAGFKSVTVDYTARKRCCGQTKFSPWQLCHLAIEALTSFSILPLKVWTSVGLSIGLLTLGYAAWMITKTVVYGGGVPGYASLLVTVLCLGSLQLVSIGILGEYLGRIYMETKQRPIYIIRKHYQRDVSD